jgi:uncharacterized protein
LVSSVFEGLMGFEASTTIAAFAAAMQASLIYCALLAIGGVLLALPVVFQRRRQRIGLGTGDDRELLRRTRIHGNYIEQMTLGLPLLLALPVAGAPAQFAHAIGLSLLVARAAHAYGLMRTSGSSFGRVFGMVLTWTALLVGAIAMLAYALSTGTALRLLAPA